MTAAAHTQETTAHKVDPPAWLSEGGRQYWADLKRHIPDGWLKAADAHAFGMLCNELATYADADTIVNQEGLIVSGPMGSSLVNPALKVRSQAADAVAKWHAFLGITPADRNKRRRPAGTLPSRTEP